MKILTPTLIVIIVTLAVGMSYFVGKSSVNNNKFAATATGSPVDLPTSTLTLTPTPNFKIILAGGILSFPKYRLTLPLGWSETREVQGVDNEKVIVSNGGYQISITQGGFGGGPCLYPGDKDFEGPSSRYDMFKELTTESGDKMRRSWDGEELKSKGFAICQFTQYGWQAPTLYGHISFTIISNPDPKIISEMDLILSSLEKI